VPESPATAPIAAWGDSLTPPFAANLQLLYPQRLVYDGGIAGQSSTEISTRQRTGGRETWVTIFWMGTNNPTQPSQIKADIAASVAALAPGNDRFIVLAVLNKDRPEELRGGDVYNMIVQLNRDLAATYPGNYLDIRAYLVAQFNPALAQDVVDAQNDVIPSSLRFDEIHLNNDGSVLVARKVKEFLDAKGW
jgi:lysophospholipase L1-like esterase